MNKSLLQFRKAIQPSCHYGDASSRYYIDFYQWCQDIFHETDRIRGRFQFRLQDYRHDNTEALLFIMKYMTYMQDLLKALPEYDTQLERRFVTENINSLLGFLERSFEERDPLSPAALFQNGYKAPVLSP